MTTMMIGSLEPNNGEIINLYSQEISDKINSTSDPLFLGPDCFNATIMTYDGKKMQFTPSISIRNGDRHLTKNKGMRSVHCIDTSVHTTVYFNNRTKHWSFYPDFSTYQKQICNYVHMSESAIWEWAASNSSDINDLTVWGSYSNDDTETIENAFNSTATSIDISIGLRSYKIIFQFDNDNNKSCFAIQKCVEDNRTRWVRRIMSVPKIFIKPDNEDYCALCCSSFEETSTWPWTKTNCGHVFHSSCFYQFSIKQSSKKCPICRSNI